MKNVVDTDSHYYFYLVNTQNTVYIKYIFIYAYKESLL